MKPLILLCNDDGIRARGLETLAGRLQDLGELAIVAPEREQSGMSHALSLDRPLRVIDHGPSRWSVDGTPADCMYLALMHLCPRPPALVVSGINHGFNLGSDFFYSGTLAAAVEATIRGLPAFAISLQRGPKSGFQVAADFAHALARAILAEGLPRHSLLSVNVPNVEGKPVRGYQWTRLGERAYRDQVEVRNDLRGRRYFWIGGPEVDLEGVPGTDSMACREQLVSVTPLELDLTSQGLLDRLPGWRLPGFEAILAEEGAERRGPRP